MLAMVAAGLTAGAGLGLLATQFGRPWLWAVSLVLWAGTAVPLLSWRLRPATDRLRCAELNSPATAAGRLEVAQAATEATEPSQQPGPGVQTNDTTHAAQPIATRTPDARARILTVEDNPSNRSLLSQQLRLLGLSAQRFDMANDGREGMQRWLQGGHALVLTDLHMPQMDGYQLTAAIRAEEARRGGPRTIVVALTAQASTDQQRRCLAAGMDACLSKPVGMHELAAALSRWLGPLNDTRANPGATGIATGMATGHDALPSDPSKDRCNEPVDVAVLASLVGDDPAVLAQFLADFLTQGQVLVDALAAAQSAGRRELACIQAHRLKSAGRSVGARRLGDLCELIEQAGKPNDWPEDSATESITARRIQTMAESVAELMAEWSRVRHALSARLGMAPSVMQAANASQEASA